MEECQLSNDISSILYSRVQPSYFEDKQDALAAVSTSEAASMYAKLAKLGGGEDDGGKKLAAEVGVKLSF